MQSNRFTFSSGGMDAAGMETNGKETASLVPRLRRRRETGCGTKALVGGDPDLSYSCLLAGQVGLADGIEIQEAAAARANSVQGGNSAAAKVIHWRSACSLREQGTLALGTVVFVRR